VEGGGIYTCVDEREKEYDGITVNLGCEGDE
jgi:hypothetical protein